MAADQIPLGTGSDPNPARSASPEEPRIQDFIFARELAEVYLLMDNISTSTGKRLPETLTGKPDEPAYAWIEQICEIGWPPSGTAVEQAKQASTLLKARDALNWTATPATGTTIAFTLLVGGDDKATLPADSSRRGWWQSALTRKVEGEPPPEPRVISGRGWVGAAPSRYSLASRAFPNLEVPAKKFRSWIRWLVFALFVWLAFTCVFSWNLAMGNAYVAQLTGLKLEKTDIDKDLDTALNGGRIQRDTTGVVQILGKPNGLAPLNGVPGVEKPVYPYCDGPRLLDPLPAKYGAPIRQFHSVAELRLCDRQSQNQAGLAAARLNISHWLLGWRWTDLLTRWICLDGCISFRNPTDELAQQRASTLLSVLGGAVLPICFGLLGAGTAVVRGLSAKMRDSLLAPRDRLLSIVQLALGAVIGGCIGLFVTPTGSGSSSTPGLIALAPLSASALCFIAGFGVEEVFLALRSLIRRVFNVPDPAKRPD